MESQERVRIIDLAWDWVKTYAHGDLPVATEPKIKAIAERFDQAYKAIVKTITSE